MRLVDSRVRALIALVAVVASLYAAFSLSGIFSAQVEQGVCMAATGCVHEQQLNFLISLMPIIACVALIVGAGTYYLMAGRLESKEKYLKKNTEALLRFLSQDERKLVNALIESNGKVLQAEITRLPGMSKVKSHRLVQKLVDRGVIEKDSVGKTNIVRFTKEIKEGLM